MSMASLETNKLHELGQMADGGKLNKKNRRMPIHQTSVLETNLHNALEMTDSV